MMMIEGPDDSGDYDDDEEMDDESLEDYDDDDDEVEDLVFERDGAKVVVDSSSFVFLKGSTIDFEQELIRSAFAIVNNPQSESACGCGTSFAAKNFETHSAAH